MTKQARSQKKLSLVREMQRTSTLLWQSAHALAHRLCCRDKTTPTCGATHFYAAMEKCPRACASFVLQGQEHAHARCNALLLCGGKVPTRLRIVYNASLCTAI